MSTRDPHETPPGIVEGDAGRHPPDGDGAGPGLEAILEEIDTVVEPIHEAVSLAPAVGIAVAGGPMITLPEEEPDDRDSTGGDSVRSGLNQAGPVALAGLVVNAAGALVVVAVARLVTSQAYGDIAQLLGLFFILSMPGSAILVGVVRRVTALQTSGQGHLVRHWIARVHRIALAAIAVEVVLVVALQGWIAHQLSLPDSQGVVLILVAAGIWILLSVDRGLLQAHRSYRALAGNLFTEGAVRTVFVIGLVSLHMGVAGYALGIFISEVVATAHAHWLASRAWRNPDDLPVHKDLATKPEHVLARRKLLADVTAAFIGLALLGLLQNVDVILLGRLDHANVGPYAAISVASKAMVFGALALGAYLLPEATIRWNEGGHAVRQLGVTLIFLAVPAAVLLGIAVFIPKWFLTVIFSARLSSAAPSFATLVAAMICLSFSVLITNYLFGTGSRWIVLLLLGGSGLAVGLVSGANGQVGATAQADLGVQGGLALGMAGAFVAIHVKHRGRHWIPWGGRSTVPPAASR